LLGARPPRAILRALLDIYVHPVIGTRQCPQLGGGSFGIRVTAILLPSRLAHGRFQQRLGRLDLPLQVLLLALILAAGVHDHGPIDLAI